MESLTLLGRFKKLSKFQRLGVRMLLFYLFLLLFVHTPFYFNQGLDPSHPVSLILAALFAAYRLLFILILPILSTSWLFDRIFHRVLAPKG